MIFDTVHDNLKTHYFLKGRDNTLFINVLPFVFEIVLNNSGIFKTIIFIYSIHYDQEPGFQPEKTVLIRGN